MHEPNGIWYMFIVNGFAGEGTLLGSRREYSPAITVSVSAIENGVVRESGF